MLKNIIRFLPFLIFFFCESNPVTETLYFKLNTEVSPGQGGIIALESGSYKVGTIRTIYAKPNTGWVFSHWEGIISGMNNPTDIILFLLYIFLKDFSRLSRTELFGYIFLISGATANLLDRLLNGSVLDFLIINYNQIYFPAVFNVADIFISFGALLIITSYVFRPNK